MNRSTVAWALAAALVLIGCGAAAALLPGAGSGPALRAGVSGAAVQADPVAKVNGQPISRGQLTDLLIQARGRQMRQLMVALEAVRQQAQAKKLTVTPADLAAEELASFPEELKNLAPAERDSVLDQYLERNNLTRTHWRLAMERQAYVRKLSAAQSPAATEEELRELFGRTYGEKVEVLHIQVDSAADLRTAKERLDKGEEFAKVAGEMSTNETSRKNGGLLKAFDLHEENVPEEIRQAAFALDKPGRRTEIQYRDHYHLLQLVRRIAPQDVKFEDVKADLARRLGEQVVRARMNYLLRAVPLEATIEVLDPVIREQIAKARTDLSAPAGPPEPIAPPVPGRGG